MATRVGSAERLRFGDEIRGRDAPKEDGTRPGGKRRAAGEAGVFLEGLGPEKRRTGREGTPRLSSREGLDSAALAARISESAVARFRSVTASRPIGCPSNGAQRRLESCARRARTLVCPCSALRRAASNLHARRDEQRARSWALGALAGVSPVPGQERRSANLGMSASGPVRSKNSVSFSALSGSSLPSHPLSLSPITPSCALLL